MNRFTDLMNRPVALAIAVTLLAVWVTWLRGPILEIPVWNVDETIHATVAEVLLDGGTLYQDAIDQRTPLTYFATAAVFALTDSSITALRILVLLMIFGVALALGRVAYRINGPFTSFGAALIFVAFSSFLLLPEDTFAAHTAWFVVFFTTAAAWCFLAGPERIPSIKRCFAAGGLLGLAVMSKQSALLDIAPPLGALIAIVVDRELDWGAALRRAAAIIAGVLVSAVIVSAPVLLSGAGADYLYYTWTYNIEIYGAEFSFPEKLWSGLHLFEQVMLKYPVLFVTGIISLLWLLARCLQFNPTGVAKTRRFGEVYLLIWLVTSTGAAMAGGRGFDHYFFPVLAPLAWACAMGPSVWFRRISEPNAVSRAGRAFIWIIGLAVSYSVFITPTKARRIPLLGPDSALRVSAWMKAQSTETDRIFVWGFNPDIYRYTDRLPASRFIYCTFQTGMIPLTNVDPARSTEYAVVDDSLETLLTDLKQNRPKFFVDSSAGPHRFFGKYPLRKFPQLDEWLHDNYVELEAQRWGLQGFRLYIRAHETINDRGEYSLDDPRGQLLLFGTDRLAPGLNRIGVGMLNTTSNSLTRLGLSLNGKIVTATSFLPLENTSIGVSLDLPPDTKDAILRPLVQFDGEGWLEGPDLKLPVVSAVTTPEQKVEIAIPVIEENVEALGIRALFGARADETDGRRVFSLHAPAVLSYSTPAGIEKVTGRFGLPPGAYAPDNPAPSDGAEFIIRHVTQQGESTELFRRLIQPLRNSVDAGEHAFAVDLPLTAEGDALELEITAGPAGVASSDWTYWADLKLQSSP